MLTKVDSIIFKKAREDLRNKRLFAPWTTAGKVWARASENGRPFCLSDGETNDGIP